VWEGVCERKSEEECACVSKCERECEGVCERESEECELV